MTTFNQSQYNQYSPRTFSERMLTINIGFFLLSLASLLPMDVDMAESFFRGMLMFFLPLGIINLVLSKIWVRDVTIEDRAGLKYYVWKGDYTKLKFLSFIFYFSLGMSVFAAITLYLVKIDKMLLLYLGIAVYVISLISVVRSGDTISWMVKGFYLAVTLVAIVGPLVWVITSVGTSTWWGIAIMIVGLIMLIGGIPAMIGIYFYRKFNK